MFFTNTTFVGIDPTAGQKPFVYAALDHELRLLALGQGNLDEVLAFTAGQHQAFTAVCAPRRPNQGFMALAERREKLKPVPHPGRWLDFRQAEYELRLHGISIPQTSSQEASCPHWMQMSFHLFRRLEGFGYCEYRREGEPRQSLEVYPHACYTALLGLPPFPKHTLEGRIQRQLVLSDCKVAVPDPMLFFEEITRHRLLKGFLPDENLFSPAELDALAAAYTAWLAASHPERVCMVGDPEEGQVVLPVPELKARY